MTCARSYQDIKAPWEDDKSPSDWRRDFIDAYQEQWGEVSKEDYEVLKKWWNYMIVEFDNYERDLELSISEMKEILNRKEV